MDAFLSIYKFMQEYFREYRAIYGKYAFGKMWLSTTVYPETRRGVPLEKVERISFHIKGASEIKFLMMYDYE